MSKLDILFAVAGLVTAPLLQRYFELARQVLGEDDPILDLPADERWAAAIRGKSREYSPALRKGVSETLVLLAVWGNHLFQERLGFDCEFHVNQLVRQLLTPLSTRTLEAHNRDLPAYAEAAPDEFLSILQEDLRRDQPVSYGLLRPAETGILGGGCPRTGLLWALENLAWHRDTLPRAALLLAQLAQVEVHDNWMNKPISSLQSIFSSWMPQTDPDHDTRLGVLKLLINRTPQIAWQLCISQLDTGSKLGHFNHKPTWRNDGYGFGEPFATQGPVLVFMRSMADMALSWPTSYSSQMVCDIVQHLHAMDDTLQTAAWALVTQWSSTASDADKAIVREAIRVAILSRRGMKRAKLAGHATMTATAKAAYQALEPSGALEKHAWLFREQWVVESADELHGDEVDFHKREARINKLRADALGEIVKAHGIKGIIELAERGKASFQIGWLMANEVLPRANTIDFLLAAMGPTGGQSGAKRNLIAGTLRAFGDQDRVTLLNHVRGSISQGDFLQLLLLSPFRRSTWQVVDAQDEAQCRAYWQGVSPEWIHNETDEGCELVERLLSYKRPRAAFACIHFGLESLGADLLFRLMSAIAKDSEETPGQYQLDQYYIEKAFQIIDKSPIFTMEQKAELEFLYIEALARLWDETATHGIPNLEKYVEKHPETFVQAVVWAYKRQDKGEDPPEWKVDAHLQKQIAERSYKLLECLARIPGYDHRGELVAGKLEAWVEAVRNTCAGLSRLDIADLCIGKLLSRAPIGQDGVWPCEPVRQVMEDLHSKSMMSGAHTGLYNSRGIVCRGEGGTQEREIANKYRRWASALAYSHPFVASELLMSMTKTYEREAKREDAAEGIERRLG